ncbi:hypothetical protein [Nesterenkonia suensis]
MNDSLTIDLAGLTTAQVGQIVETVRGMRSSTSAHELEPELPDWHTAESTGWTIEHVEYLRGELAARGKRVQLAAFEAALENDGYISRGDLYALAGYGPDRKLNKWTSPFRSITAELVDERGLPEGAALPMEAGYTDAPSYQQTHGFVVAPEIVKLVHEQG